MPKQQYSTEQWQALIDQQAASGQTLKDFCARRGLSRSTFQRWKSRLTQDDAVASSTPPSAQPLFAPLLGDGPGTSPNATEAGVAEGWEIELDLGAGVCLRLRRQP